MYLLAVLFASTAGCVGNNELSRVDRLIDEISQLAETADIRSAQALDEIRELPAKVNDIGASLISTQLTEYTATSINRLQDSADCLSADVDDRIRANLKSLASALAQASQQARERDEAGRSGLSVVMVWLCAVSAVLAAVLMVLSARGLLPQSVRDRSGVLAAVLALVALGSFVYLNLPRSLNSSGSRWEEFLKAIADDRYAPVLIPPRVCSTDTDVITVKYTDRTETAVIIIVPSNQTLIGRGYALRRPDPEKIGCEDPYRVEAEIVDHAGNARDVSELIRYNPENSFQLAFDDADKPIRKGDQYLRIRYGSSPDQIKDLNIVFQAPDPPDQPPAATVISMRIAGRTEGGNEDARKGLHVMVYAGQRYLNKTWNLAKDPNQYVAVGWDLWWAETYKNQDMPPQHLELATRFDVPDSGLLWVRAGVNHDVDAKFILLYDVQTYTWGQYNFGPLTGGNGDFSKVEARQFTFSEETGYKEFRYNDGDGENNTLLHAFRWKTAP